MRVLWFVNAPPQAIIERFPRELGGRNQGSWLLALEEALLQRGNVALGVAWATEATKEVTRIQSEAAAYYCTPKRPPRRFIGNWTIPRSWEPEVGHCLAVVKDFQPDIVHVHGTEGFYGLVTQGTKTPVVVSINGMPGECAKVFWGNLGWREILELTSFYEVMRGRGMLHDFRAYLSTVIREREIIAANHNFIGRTRWDRAHVYELNPAASYFHCDDMLRREFYSACWDLQHMTRGRIFTVAAMGAFKGTHTLLRAVAHLRRNGVEVTLHIGGAIGRYGYGRFLYQMVECLGLEGCVTFRGNLDACGVVSELIASNAFVLPSFIENSSNSLCEAMMVGTPVVASSAGGTPALVSDSESGLLFPAGDIAWLARSLLDVLESDDLAQRLSVNARLIAQRRHDRATILNTQLRIYETVLTSRDASSS